MIVKLCSRQCSKETLAVDPQPGPKLAAFPGPVSRVAHVQLVYLAVVSKYFTTAGWLYAYGVDASRRGFMAALPDLLVALQTPYQLNRECWLIGCCFSTVPTETCCYDNEQTAAIQLRYGIERQTIPLGWASVHDELLRAIATADSAFASAAKDHRA
jgi:hypothetical protein